MLHPVLILAGPEDAVSLIIRRKSEFDGWERATAFHSISVHIKCAVVHKMWQVGVLLRHAVAFICIVQF